MMQKTGPNPAIKKKVRLNCLSYNCRIYKKKKKRRKILAPYTPEKNFSAPACCEKNIPAQEKNPPLLI